MTTLLVSLYQVGLNKKLGHWACWMSTGRKSDFDVKNTHIIIYIFQGKIYRRLICVTYVSVVH